MTVILQGLEDIHLADVAIELSASEACWLVEKLNPALAQLQWKKHLARGIYAVAIPEHVEESYDRTVI